VIVLPATWLNGDSIRAIVERDLDYGDRVTVIRASDSLGVAARGPLNYPLFARLGAAAVVQLSPSQNGVRAVLHDVGQKKVAAEQDFALPLVAANTPEWRMGVHGVSDELETWITGVRGVAQTRILYTRGREIRVVDSDGANDHAVGTGLSPAWHPNGQSIAFMVVGDSGNRLGVRNIAGGTTRWVVSKPYSVAITPAFSRDGSLLAYAYGEESGADIYVVPALSTGAARRVTIGHGSENFNPSFSPDGRKLAFTSSRPGHPEIYITDTDGTNVELLTQYNVGDQADREAPDWSPDGRTIAYHAQVGGAYQIFTIGLRERLPRQLTSDAINSDPWWAPDSRHVVFSSTRTGIQQLFVMDVESGRVRQLTFGGGGARLGSWSLHLSPT
jgi:TolB protein